MRKSKQISLAVFAAVAACTAHGQTTASAEAANRAPETHSKAAQLVAKLLETNALVAGKDGVNWVLCRDEDGQARKETMQFFPEGYGMSLHAHGLKSPFLYKLDAPEVMVIANAAGNLVPLKMRLSADAQLLTFNADKPGNASTYVRAGQEAKHQCASYP